jgi:Xaa-Pro aminopeptidase
VTALVERATRPAIPPERYVARMEALRALLREQGAAALLAGPGAELRYLAGYHALALERLTMLVVPAERDPVLIVPRLERDPAESSAAASVGIVGVRTWEETDDPYALVAEAVGDPGSRSGAVYVADRLWAMFVLPLEAVFGSARLVLASAILQALRMTKDAEEIALLRAGAHAADRVVTTVSRGRLVGRTEADVSREIVERLVDEGHDGAEHGQIVASGPYSASPHHIGGTRVIGAGEALVFDIGGSWGGYASDTTRTIWVGGPDAIAPDAEFVTIYDTVRRAYDAGVAAVRPGVSCESVDAAAREVIAAAGYGSRFVHRTGLEVHEEPYNVAGNRRRLEPGYAFSVEPGIYLEGRYGARLEDIVVCTSDGADVLNEGRRELSVVSG